MSHALRTAVAIVTLMLAPAEAAHAQAAQTTQTAQDFLAQVLPTVVMLKPDLDEFDSIADCYSVTCPSESIIQAYNRRSRTFTIESIRRQPNYCFTETLSSRAARPLYFPGEYRGGGWDQSSPAETGYSEVIGWAEIVSVETQGSSVIITGGPFVGPTRRLQFNFGAESMAARVGYAMEFLRLQCDPTARTGF